MQDGATVSPTSERQSLPKTQKVNLNMIRPVHVEINLALKHKHERDLWAAHRLMR